MFSAFLCSLSIDLKTAVTMTWFHIPGDNKGPSNCWRRATGIWLALRNQPTSPRGSVLMTRYVLENLWAMHILKKAGSQGPIMYD